MMTWPWRRVFQSFLFEPLRLIAQKVITLFELLTLKRNWRPLNDFTHEMDLRIVKPRTVIKEPYSPYYRGTQKSSVILRFISAP